MAFGVDAAFVVAVLNAELVVPFDAVKALGELLDRVVDDSLGDSLKMVDTDLVVFEAPQ